MFESLASATSSCVVEHLHSGFTADLTDPMMPQVTSHPFLCEGIEDDYVLTRSAGKDDELQRLIASSGKMLLLAKLLPKLRAEGHKVPSTRCCQQLWIASSGRSPGPRRQSPTPASTPFDARRTHAQTA